MQTGHAVTHTVIHGDLQKSTVGVWTDAALDEEGAGPRYLAMFDLLDRWDSERETDICLDACVEALT